MPTVGGSLPGASTCSAVAGSGDQRPPWSHTVNRLPLGPQRLNCYLQFRIPPSGAWGGTSWRPRPILLPP
eukprot:11148423-Alexandrium_andersonii.AAC.1